MKNPFIKEGLTIKQIVHIVSYEEDIVAFLKDIQQDYRIQRSMGPDEGDKLLNGTYVIDDIIARIPRLEEARAKYFAEKKAAEELKREQESKKNGNQ